MLKVYTQKHFSETCCSGASEDAWSVLQWVSHDASEKLLFSLRRLVRWISGSSQSSDALWERRPVQMCFLQSSRPGSAGRGGRSAGLQSSSVDRAEEESCWTLDDPQQTKPTAHTHTHTQLNWIHQRNTLKCFYRPAHLYCFSNLDIILLYLKCSL